MARGPKKHLKRLNAPKAWMLDKLGGVYAPRPSTGPHKLRECLPLVIFLRNRLKYALTGNEVLKIVKQRLIKVDGKVRTDPTYPAGFMDVVSIEKTNELFRLIYDVKGRFTIHRITPEEAKYKLCKVKRVATGPKNVPYLVTHDGRTIRYPDPLIKVNDSIQLDIATTKIMDFIKFESGNLCMITGGRNLGRVGTIVSRERHPGSFDIVHIKDSTGHTFATRYLDNYLRSARTKTDKSHFDIFFFIMLIGCSRTSCSCFVVNVTWSKTDKSALNQSAKCPDLNINRYLRKSY
ncbi:small ribosomal subunit protein eS4 isoform X1 [Bombyx mori]